MFGAIPADLIMDMARKEGYMKQEDMDFREARLKLDPQYCTSIPTGIEVEDDGTGRSYSCMGSKDHPKFTEVRDWLEQHGYIKTERSWSNGDRVLEPFYLNDHRFDKGDVFPCAPAMSNILGSAWVDTYFRNNVEVYYEEDMIVQEEIAEVKVTHDKRKLMFQIIPKK